MKKMLDIKDDIKWMKIHYKLWLAITKKRKG